MKRKISTVNPMAGTLKQQDRALRINRQSGFVKSIAFALLLSLTAPAVTLAMGDLADTGKEFNTRIDRSIPDSCCVVDTHQNKRNYKVVRLAIPSTDMLRKADNEVSRNLAYSLKENKLRRMEFWLERSDREISEQFTREYSIAGGLDPAKTDTEIAARFDAENIPARTALTERKADEDMHDMFRLENQGLSWSSNSELEADKAISMQFALEHTKISLPSAADFAKADADMKINQGMARVASIALGKY